SGLQLGHFPVIVGQGENLHPKPEFARATLDSLVFPATDILCPPILSSAVIRHQRDHIHGAPAAPATSISHQRAQERIGLIAKFFCDAPHSFAYLQTDSWVVPQSTGDGRRSNAETLRDFRHAHCLDLVLRNIFHQRGLAGREALPQRFLLRATICTKTAPKDTIPGRPWFIPCSPHCRSHDEPTWFVPTSQLFNATILMPKVEQEMHKAGDFLV